jgi:hypothetical protein
MTTLRSSSIRHRIDPLDIPAVKAARRLHLTLEQFRDKLPELIERGFPPPDPTTGNFFLLLRKLSDRIAQWMKMGRPGDLPPRALMVNLSVRLHGKASGKAARGRPNSNLSGTVEPGGRIAMT